MNPTAPSPFSLSEIWWRGIILALSLTVLLFSVWCLTHGITTIFMHLYYFPIVLLAYRYRWKGFGLATLLAFAYLSLVIVFDYGQSDVILGASYRFLVFVGIAAVIAYLSDRLLHAQSSLQQSAEITDRYLSLAPTIVLALDRNGAITFLNKKGGEILECNPAEVTGKLWTDRFLPEIERERVKQVISQLMDGHVEPNRLIENLVLTSSGIEKSIRWSNTVLRDENGSITGLLSFGEDITMEKWGQDTLREMQQFQESVITNANVWISVLEPDGTLLVWNDAAEAISGYKKSGVLGKRTVWKQLYPDNEYRKKVTGDIQRIIGKDTFLENFETEIRCADGTKKVIVWNTRGQRDTKGIITSYIAIGRDITEHKQAEAALMESKALTDAVVENVPLMIFLKEATDLRFVLFNRAGEELLGYDRQSLLGKNNLELFPPEQAAQFMEKDREVLEGDAGMLDIPEEPIMTAKKGLRLLHTRKVCIHGSDGTTKFLLGISEDITERKAAEEELRSREEQFRVIFHNQQTGLIMVDAVTHTIADANAAALSMIGASREDVTGKICHTFICPAEMGKCPVTDLCQTVDNSERVLIRANGERIPILKSVNPVTIGDRPFLIESFIDLTERKRMEKQVSESRQLFADIISFLPDPTFVIDNEGKVLAWNRAIEELSGVSAADMIGKGDHEYSLWEYGKRRPILIDLVLHPDQDAARLNYTSIRWEERTITAETDVILPGSGRKVSFSLVASPLMDTQDKVTGAIESIRDISSLREAEAELSRLNANLEVLVHNRTRELEEEVAQRMDAEKDVQAALSYTRSVIEANPDLMVVLDRNGTVLDINAAAEFLTGLTRDQLIGTPYFGYLVDDGTLYTAFSQLLETGMLENVIHIRHTDGHVTPLSLNATMIGGRDATDARIIVSAHDITRQKRDEEAIKASLEEKVILLREVHHRVKNNLQIIISLVNLQMRQTEDPEVKQIMSETQNRVRAMSLVHEKLYRSESLSRIDFADYTRYLATQLLSFYGSDTRRVRLDFVMGKIMVDINTAVPLGLLMNEIVSNALKHAFPNGGEGTISISGSEKNNIITLVVRDDGVGIPADFDWKNTTSLGMRLVTSLIDQVDGTIDLDRTGGTTFTVTVKKDPAQGGTR